MGEMTPEQIEALEATVQKADGSLGCHFEAIGYLGRLEQAKAIRTLLTAWRRGEDRIKELEGVLAFHAQASKDSDAHIRSLAKQRNDAERSLAEARERLEKLARLTENPKDASIRINRERAGLAAAKGEKG